MRHRLLAAVSLLALSGCMDDGDALQKQVEHAAFKPLTIQATLLKNYALSHATGAGDVGIIKEAMHGLRSLTCVTDAKARKGLFFAWLDNNTKADADLLGGVARDLGAQSVGQWQGEVLIKSGKPQVLPDACPLPVLSAGRPVVIVSVVIPAAVDLDGAVVETERKPSACPDGEKGSIVYMRTVIHRGGGHKDYTDWAVESEGCVAAVSASSTITEGTPPNRGAAFAGIEISAFGDLEDAIADNLPDNCKRVTIATATAGTEGRTKSFDTCDFAELLPPEVAAPVTATPRTPRPPLPPVVCPPSPVVLPTYSSVVEYEAALAPYKALLPLPKKCTLAISSGAWWPFYQSFVLYNPPVWSGGAWHLTDTTTEITRLYKVLLNLTWKAENGAATFTEWHEKPRQGMGVRAVPHSNNLASFPAAFVSGGGYSYFHARFMLSGSGVITTTYRQNGVTHPYFMGPHTIINYDGGGGLNGWFPLAYYHDKTAPWSNTPEEQAHRPIGAPIDFDNEDERGSALLTN